MATRIKKRKRSLGTHLDEWTKSFKGIPLWLGRMTSGWVYREEFIAALWGEMGEYEVRFSTIVGGFGFIALAIANAWFLPGAVFLVKTKFLLTLVFLFIGVRQLKDLNGPIWWADRFATRALNSYNQTGTNATAPLPRAIPRPLSRCAWTKSPFSASCITSI